MSTLTHPDAKGVSHIHLGGEYVGFITDVGEGRFEGETFNGKVLANKTHPKNIAIKTLVKYFRLKFNAPVIQDGVI